MQDWNLVDKANSLCQVKKISHLIIIIGHWSPPNDYLQHLNYYKDMKVMILATFLNMSLIVLYEVPFVKKQ